MQGTHDEGLLARLGLNAADCEAVLPLTPMQRDLYVDALLNPGRGHCSIGYTFDIHAAVDHDLWQRALQAVADACPALRATLHAAPAGDGEIAYQAIHHTLPVALTVHDLSGAADAHRLYPAANPAPGVEALVHELIYREYDLGDPACPLVSYALIKLGETRYLSVLAGHHTVLDASGFAAHCSRVKAAYAALAEGQTPQLAADNYAEFVVATRARFDTPATRASWAELARGLDALSAPGPNGAVSDAGHMVRSSARIDANHLARIRAYGEAHGLKPHLYFKALYALLLRTYCQPEADFSFADVKAGRSADFAGTVACAIQQVPFVCRLESLAPDNTLAAWFATVRAQRALLGDAHDISIGLQNELLPRSAVGFVYNYIPFDLRETFLGQPAAQHHLKNDAHGQVQFCPIERDGGIDLDLYYYPEEFLDQRFAARIAALSEQVLAGAQRIGDLDCLLPEDVAQLAGWNATAVDYPAYPSVHARIEAQVAATPEAIAAEYDGATLSYRQLNRRANQLAALLQAQGVQPGDRVALILERALDMSVAILGVLKAGAAYVPIDPEAPAERIAYMLETSGAAHILTQTHLQALAPAGLPVLALDAQAWRDSAEFDANPQTGVGPQDVFNVIFTSGSTGRPKGVMVPHGGILNRIEWMQAEYGLTPEDRILQKTPYSFDVSVWEFIWPLFVGARLVYAMPGGHKDPDYLSALIAARGITTLHFVPSMLAVFLQARGAEALPIRRVFCSGEALTMETVRRFCARHPGVELHNLYGPTEASVDVSYWPCDPDHPQGLVPIGKPVANTTLHVLGRHLERLPAGVPGELHIGGVQLALGYIQRPELTAEKFIADPYGAPGSRLYKTGDLARWLPDGNLDYLGRIDHQIKLRGFRIELGEIEAVATEFPGVQQSYVMLRDIQPGQQELVAYLAIGDAVDFDVDAVKAYLAAKLPEYMVPAYWVTVPSMPLSPNGKLDRKALPAPVLASAGAYVAPRTAAETTICAVFAAVLGREQVGVHDDFFLLGGHSLLAARAMARITEQLAVTLPLKALFAARTPEALAGLAADAAPGTAAVPLPQLPRDGALPLSFGQERLWLLDRMEGERNAAAFLMPMVLRVSGRLDEPALRASLNDILARHEALRTVFQPLAGGGVEARLLPPGPLPLVVEECNEAALPGRLATLAATRFDLTREPSLKAWLLRLRPDDARLVLLAHHINFDGSSMGIVLRELAALYRARVAGEAPALPPPGCQYPDFAAWQREVLSGPGLQARLDYWKQTLAGAPPQLLLPTARPRPPVLGSRGRNAVFHLPAEDVARIDAAARAQGVTPYMLLLAAYAVLLHKLSGQTDIVIGSGAANRGREAFESLVGFVANVWALRAPLGGDPTLSEVLARIRVAVEGSVDAQDTPFEAVVEALNPPRSSACSPIFQAMFLYQNAAERRIELPGATLQFESLPEVHFAHDCLLQLYPEGETLVGEWAYNTDLFDETAIQRWAEALRAIVHSVCTQPALPLSALALPGPQPAIAEIEAALLASGKVSDIAVLNLPDAQGLPRAVAYAVPAAEIDAGEFATELAQVLAGTPWASLPCVPVARLPLDASGQPDGGALAALPVCNEDWRQRQEAHMRALCGGEETVLRLSPHRVPVPRLPAAEWLAALAEQGKPAEGEGAEAAPPSLAEGAPLVFEPGAPTTLGGVLRRAARDFSAHGICYLDEAGQEQRESYADLLARAESLLGGLRQRGAQRGDKVLFLLPRTADFVAAFWGCVLGGAIPVPLTAPKLWDSVNADLLKLKNTWLLLGKPRIVTSRALLPKASAAAALLDCPEMRFDGLEALLASPRDSAHVDADPDSPALFLLTSGSTGTPKAVQQSHRAILSRTRAQVVHNGDHFDDTSFNWMPIDHVGGIVMFHIRDTYVGARQVHAPTEWVLADPLRWLDAMHAHRVSITWAPNFAFGLVNECEAEMAGRSWDLSALRFILNAGEAIVPQTARKFLRLLIPHGLPADSMKPCWGMSETCSGVTYHADFRLDTTSDRDQFCEVGKPIPGFAFRIVDEHNQVLPEGTVGQLQVRGPNVTMGYYDNAEANAEALQPEGWFATGDLGVCKGGSLAITGRAKDLIIINGINYVGHEIEKFVEELDGVEPSFTAAVAARVADGASHTDRLVIFFVPRRPEAAPATVAAIRAQVQKALGLRPDFVVPVERDEIPKTNIGKIQRTQLSKRFSVGEFLARLPRAEDEGLAHGFFRRAWVARRAAGPVLDGPLAVLGEGALAAPLAAALQAQGETVLRTADALPARLVLAPATLDEVLALAARLIAAEYRGALYCVSAGLPGSLAALPGLLRTLAQELPGAALSLLDGEAAGLAALAAECRHRPRDAEVRLRGGQRTVARLEPIEFTPAKLQARLPYGAGYVVSGGLGGIGRWLCRHLLERHGAQLLVLGTTPQAGLSAAAGEVLAELAALGSVQYAALDIADASALEAALAAAEAAWAAQGVQLAAAFHLAGRYAEAALAEETPAALAAALAPKLGGAAAFAACLARRPAALLVNFSSVAGYFGGRMVGAYAAANSALATLAEAGDGSRQVCLNWSNWADTGMSAGYGARALSEARGYRFLSPAEALEAMELALASGEANVYIGLDRSRPLIRQAMNCGDLPLLDLQLYSRGEPAAPWLLADALGRPLALSLRHLDALQSPATVEAAQAASGAVAPRNALEGQIAALVQEILKKPVTVGITDNFFDLGMTSLVLSRLHHRLKNELGLNLSLVDLFRFTTIEKLLAHVQPANADGSPAARPDEAADGEARAAQRRAAQGRRTQRPRSRDFDDE